MKTAMMEIDVHLRTRIRIIIWKQWKVPKKRQWGLQKLGVDKDLAKLTAYCGDCYYFVAAKTCVSRAISKDVLARAGLVGCFDYYLERHAFEVMLNRHMPNGMCGDVRGENYSPLLDL